MRSGGEWFYARKYVHRGTGYHKIKGGFQLSYEFLADNGEKEVRADGGIFEPLYYQVDVEKTSSPSEAFQLRGKNGKKIEVRRNFKITSLEYCQKAAGRSSEMGYYLPA